MCYSAEVWADYRRFEREFGSVLSIRDFVHLFGRQDPDGKRVVRAMRYGCRTSGKPANYDVRYPGTYNARRDNLEGF
jgi:hypothetical protein